MRSDEARKVASREPRVTMGFGKYFFTLVQDPDEHSLAVISFPAVHRARSSLVGCRLWGRTESDMTEAT